MVISIDTWRAEVAAEAVAAGADLINDTWAGADPGLAEVAAATGAGLVCSHAGGLRPRTRPHRAAFDDVVADVVATVTGLADRAVSLGVRRDGILIDPAHDFGKNTRHSLELTRRLDELVATGWPVLVALSNKDFVGETLDVPVDRAAGGHARGDGGVGVARRPGVPRPPGARDPPGGGHGGRDPGRPPAGRRPPRPRLTRPADGQVQRRMRLRQAYRMPSASTATKIAISTTVTMPNPGRSKTTAQGKRNTASTANST